MRCIMKYCAKLILLLLFKYKSNNPFSPGMDGSLVFTTTPPKYFSY